MINLSFYLKPSFLRQLIVDSHQEASLANIPIAYSCFRVWRLASFPYPSNNLLAFEFSQSETNLSQGDITIFIRFLITTSLLQSTMRAFNRWCQREIVVVCTHQALLAPSLSKLMLSHSKEEHQPRGYHPNHRVPTFPYQKNLPLYFDFILDGKHSR